MNKDISRKRAVLPSSVSKRLSKIAASGVTGRGPSCLCRDDLWQRSLDLLRGKKRIAVISGFYVPSASAAETDGPPGSAVLARALLWLGRDVRIWTDRVCLDSLKVCAKVLDFPEECVLVASDDPSEWPQLLVYIERLGRAADGMYYNMRGEDISDWTSPLDAHALRGLVPVIAVGDGGNEVGMGCLTDRLSVLMRDFSRCLCVVGADVCIPVDVSNWGAYALVAALSFVEGRWLGQTEEEERRILEALSESGAVDGRTKERTLSVDGIPLDGHLNVRSSLEKLAKEGF